MAAKAKKHTIEINDQELSLLLQSLDHCLKTCKNKGHDGGPCADCDQAKALRNRLKALQ